MRTKILLLCLGSTLCALILQTIFFQNASSSMIYAQEKKQSSNSLQNMQNEIYTFVKSIESSLIEIYNEKEFEQSLKEETSTEILKEENYRLAYNFSTENFDTSDGVVALYIYDIKDEIISTFRRVDNYPNDIYEDMDQNNAKKIRDYVASDDTTLLISSYYNEYRKSNIVRFVLKIYENTNTKSKMGYIVCDIDSKVFKNIMEKYFSQEQMFMWLQPFGDRQVLSIGTLEEVNQSYYENITTQIESGALEDTTDLTGVKPILFQVEQNKYNLCAYSIMPQSLLQQNQRTLTQNLIFIAAIMSIVITALSVFLSSSLTKPLEHLTETIVKIKSGKTHQRVEYSKEDEIGKLGQNFNEMLDEIERHIGREFEAELLLNKAEYKSLQAQINPHFLYNTLDTMSSIASIQNCSVVSNLCQSLSNIFRYSLDVKHPYSTVGKEIMHLKNFIYVMKVRMGETVEYQFNIDENILQDSIPRISIQPLVENALKHGLRNARGNKTIEVNAFAQGETLQIIVKDNGVGMDADAMNAKLDANNKDAVETGNSIGLLNINARMKMLYGEKYGLYIESELEVGTSVILRIPRVKVDEVETWQT